LKLRAGHLSIYGSLSHCERAEGAQVGKAHVFDETFGVNSAFNAEVFVATPHAVTMEFDLFGERRSNGIYILDSPSCGAIRVKLKVRLCEGINILDASSDGSATLMRRKFATCRLRNPSFSSGLRPAPVKDRLD